MWEHVQKYSTPTLSSIRNSGFGIIHDILLLGHFENILLLFSFVRSILNKAFFFPFSLALILVLHIISAYSKIQDPWKIISTGFIPVLSSLSPIFSKCNVIVPWASLMAQEVKNPWNSGDTGDACLIPGSGISPGGRNGNPL